jgi:ABC-2 type transport system permease protein
VSWLLPASSRGAFSLVRHTWTGWLQHRAFFFLLAFGWMVPPLIYLFVWTTAAGEESIGGYDRATFVTYYLAFIVANQITYSQTNWTVGDVIRSGGLNPILLRPLSPLFETIASEIAGKVVYLIFVIPVTALLALWLQPALPALSDVALTLPALLLAWLLRFFWGYWLALLAFWATRADALLALQDALVFLLAGQVAPVALLPGPLQQAATWLPFRYMVGFPVELLSGQLTPAAIRNGFAFQLAWLAVALALAALLWRRGLQRYTAVGG